MFTTAFTETIPKFLTVVEKRLTANNSPSHIVGDKITIADFSLGNLFVSLFYNDANEKSVLLRSLLENFPHVKAYAESFKEGDLKEYLATRPVRPF